MLYLAIDPHRKQLTAGELRSLSVSRVEFHLNMKFQPPRLSLSVRPLRSRDGNDRPQKVSIIWPARCSASSRPSSSCTAKT